MGILPRNPGEPEQRKQGKCKQMSDVATANYLIQAIGGGGKVNAFLYAAYETLNRLFPHQGEPEKQWTLRRLRAWWNNETDVVRHWQMLELYQAAEHVNSQRDLLEKARKEHADFIEKTARIAALLERSEAFGAGGMAEREGGVTR